MEYNFRDIEKKWQAQWKASGAYKVSNDSPKPKFYVLDMFPYPSGVGLHVGHPLGYIASDIYSRFKRLKGFNVLHPMGYDAFGLPAEQYAIDHGIHPAISTETNINTFRRQLDNIGFCFDWDREFRTSDPKYYKWTQWIFLQLFNGFYNRQTKKAEPIANLVKAFEKEGNTGHGIPHDKFVIAKTGKRVFTAAEWKGFTEREQQDILMEYRLAFCGYGEVNWCEALGTVLANDEVVNGVSERGGYPVVKKKLRQWYLRITEYADRLLEGLDRIEFSESMKEMQTNWIGKSYGAEIAFDISGNSDKLTVYTTRPDTIFGVDFMVIAPEHALIKDITSSEQQQAVEEYVEYVQSRSERERMAEKKISGVFTGAYAINPFNGAQIPIWISEYVLAGYGTGAIMAVPCGDERDHKFANHFNIPITNIIGSAYDGKEANATKDARLENSDFLNGMVMREAMEVVIQKIEEMRIGVRKVNFRMRDAAFSRQRYWGEPFPIKWQHGIAYPMSENELPLELPHVESYKPGPEGEGPLANIPAWTSRELETNTMPGYAGSSWYFLRYMDPHNDTEFCSRKTSDYWGQVDIYIGGTEHAVGHLLYSRMWTKALFDLGFISHDEPYKKLVNQGMIQGSSRFVYRVHGTNKYVSLGLKDQYETDAIHVDVNMVDGVELDVEQFKKWRAEYETAEFILEDGKYICGTEVEKMSKRLYNTVNPDDVVNKYGADTFRMYEMFLGPVEQSKPWETKGIEGTHRFLKKLWRLFYDDVKGKVWNEEKATPAELKVLHKTIKKIEEDTERFSFNTAVSAFMVCVNELIELKCNKKEILESLLILLTPYAPHVSEELWRSLGNNSSILDAAFPTLNESYLVESSKEYPISVNGKLRTTLTISLDTTQEDVEKIVLGNEVVQKWLEGKPHKRIIYVKGKMVNVVV
ncbi:leucine--tRNA ligase [Niastella yeongjuensis]|uniref:Leucine--tRNA ligase n=1 Tax=Niastella yeongjuensis TaxID=354355 RepID=A0A1V9EY29_9BACT|nr:leucine--tRNA ligase [Niastella yeongjuensis]OQP50979.1 leucine--tRNA ligase [Niastella yeongjuensis]SEN08662.1 leucyl-tRNA synthetase [Niastella yeongjuensis]